eukprot:6492653-Amphidinium_carterae.1
MPVVRKHLECLEKPLTISSCAEVKLVLEELPPLKRMLRDGACKSLEDKALSVVKALGQMAHATDHEMSNADAQLLLQTLTEAGSLWPLETSFQADLSKASEIVESSAITGLLLTVVLAMQEVVNTSLEDNKAFVDAVATATSKLESCQVPADMWKEADLAVSKKCVLKTMDGIAALWSGNSDRLVVCATLANCVASLVQQVDLSKLVDYVCAAVKLRVAAHDSHTCDADVNPHEALNKAVAVQRALLLCKKPDWLPDDLKHAVVELVQDLTDEANASLLRSKTLLLAKAKDELTKNVDSLKSMCLGANGGANWLDGFHGDSWEHMLTHAAGSILKQDAAHLVATLKTVQKEPQRGMNNLHCPELGLARLPQDAENYEKVGATLDVACDQEVVACAQDIVTKSCLTKSTGVLLFHFSKGDLDASDLRGKVQSEIKWLRSHGLQEKGSLHPMIFDKVSKALALRA